jgi:hypothetical protein
MSPISQLGLIVLMSAMAIAGPALAAALLLWRRRRARAARRSPLTKDLLRGPGHGVRVELDRLRDQVDESALLLVTMPLAVYAVHITQSYVFAVPESSTRTLAAFAIGLGSIAWTVIRLMRVSIKMDRMRIGLDAELSVGQELDQLMRDGAVVYHDVPGTSFNIDHVVIARSGVFAVETKGRAKPIRGKGSGDATVEFDGSALHFPLWSETKPLSQAQQQARWLAQWLSSATGAPIPVEPVLAIPGWFIERKARSEVLIYNGKNPGFLLQRHGADLSEEMIKRIAHQIDQQCRTVRPSYTRDQAAPQ